MDELDLEYFFFRLPLYKTIVITGENWDQFIILLNFGKGSSSVSSIEGYNPLRRQQSTFGGWSNVSNTDSFVKYGGTESIKIKCKRYEDVLHFYVHYDPGNTRFMKVGQYPSVADFHIYELGKYSKVLSKEKLKEFSRGIGLAANGVGIGSFVYLRRIFEYLITATFTEHESTLKMTKSDFMTRRMDDKIELLKEHLPTFLVESKSLYSILSLGIHELNEDDCLAHFDIVRVGIEIILDQRLEAIKKKEKEEEGRKKISQLTAKLKGAKAEE